MMIIFVLCIMLVGWLVSWLVGWLAGWLVSLLLICPLDNRFIGLGFNAEHINLRK
jgi:hypothetical protein